MTNNTNTYKKVTREALQKIVLQGKKPSILVFSASWSGNAEMMNSMMSRISQENKSTVNFFEVDVEKYPDITSSFGVTTVPTTVILKEGEIIGVIKGFTSANNIRKRLEAITR